MSVCLSVCLTNVRQVAYTLVSDSIARHTELNLKIPRLTFWKDERSHLFNIHGWYIARGTTKQILCISYAFVIIIIVFISFLLTILNNLNIAHECTDAKRAQTRHICSTGRLQLGAYMIRKNNGVRNNVISQKTHEHNTCIGHDLRVSPNYSLSTLNLLFKVPYIKFLWRILKNWNDLP